MPATESGSQPGNLLHLPPHGGDRTSTSRPQEESCPSSFQQAIRTTTNPRRREVKSGSNERPHRSKPKPQTYGMALRGESRVTYHGNRPSGDYPWPRLAHPNAARELADLLTRGASIGRIVAGHHFRGGQLLVGLLRTLRTVIRIVEIEQQQRGSRMRP